MGDESIAEHRSYGDQPMAVRGGMLCKNITVKQCIEFNSTHSSSTSAILVVSGTTTVSRLISATVTPATVDEFIYVDVTYTTGTDCMYIKTSSVATSGTLQAGRFRSEGRAAGSSTMNVHAVHAQGIAYAAKYAGTVNAIYAEAIAKATSTVTTIRGAMIACDSEGTPTAIGTMLGAEIRCKSAKDPSTAFENLRLTAEKFGSGYALDAHITIGSTTWTSGETAADAGIEFTSTAKITSLIETTTPCTSVIKFATNTGEGFEEGSLKDSDSANIKCDAYIKYMQGSTPYYGALYNTTN